MADSATAVVDASVLGAAFFNEIDSEVARRFLADNPSLIAPDLIFAEIASLAAKKVWRGEAGPDVGARAVRAIGTFVHGTAALEGLADLAFEMAARHHLSAYDCCYLALAQARDIPLFTLDDKLISKAAAVGIAVSLKRPS